MKQSLIVSLLAAGCVSAATSDYTFMGGADSFGDGASSVVSSLVSDSSKETMGVTGSITGSSLSISPGSTATVSSGVEGSITADNNCGAMLVISLTGLQESADKTPLFSFRIGNNSNHYGINFVLDTSQGLANSSLIMYLGASVSSAPARTATVTGLDLSGSTVTLALGYNRDDSNTDSLFAMSSADTSTLLTATCANYNLGGSIDTLLFGSTQIMSESDLGIATGTFDIENAYMYTSTTAATASDVAAFVVAAQARLVPEPTASALSLLALASLAARRRRR